MKVDLHGAVVGHQRVWWTIGGVAFVVVVAVLALASRAAGPLFCSGVVVVGLGLGAYGLWEIISSQRRAQRVDRLVAQSRYPDALEELRGPALDWSDDAVQAATAYCYEMLGKRGRANAVLLEAERLNRGSARVKGLREWLNAQRVTPLAPPEAPGRTRPHVHLPVDFASRYLWEWGGRWALFGLCFFVMVGPLIGRANQHPYVAMACAVLLIAGVGLAEGLPMYVKCRRAQRLAEEGDIEQAIEDVWRWPARWWWVGYPQIGAYALTLLGYCYECQGRKAWTNVLLMECERKFPREYVTRRFRQWLERERAAQPEEAPPEGR